jgi:hypothetical protein
VSFGTEEIDELAAGGPRIVARRGIMDKSDFDGDFSSLG